MNKREKAVSFNGRNYRFLLDHEGEKAIAAWIEVKKGWREVKLLTRATVAAANGNGLIVKE